VSADQDRRQELVAAVAGHVLAHGLTRTSLKELAAAAGTSDRMLLYYFPDKAALMAATLDHLAATLMAALDAQRAPAPLPEGPLLERLSAQVQDPASWPFLQLWLEIAARAARDDVEVQAVAGRIGQGFLGWVAGQLAAPDDAARAAAARRVLASVEGQVVLKAVGLS
jgi:AcrR family transcriptional regulator